MRRGSILGLYIVILMLSACSWDRPTHKREVPPRRLPPPISYDATTQATPAPINTTDDQQISSKKKKAASKK